MNIARSSRVPEEAAVNPLFTGGPVTRQAVVPPELSENYTCSLINFSRGSRNKFHAHTSDQILVITSGIGIVATEAAEREVAVGDVVLVPAGEKHWHGAGAESYMSHISITIKGSQTAQLEE